MVRIAPIRLSFNPKTLWFDARDLELSVGDKVVVTTVRGKEFGEVSQSIFQMDYEDTRKLQSPLKPVERVATEEDIQRNEERMQQSLDALPLFRRMAAEMLPDMNPVAVEYLFEGDKAVFYFDAEERVDFRELVRSLAGELQVRVDMKQIGVRDGARIVGGLGHCGQELCCRRLGGEFNPVSIRMAKEQDLSLNPQKISGICGRLMCCLRYEFDAYKDFHSRAPKKNARVQTPEGEGKVVDMDVPREIIMVKVGDDKPVKVPLSSFEEPDEGERPSIIGEEAWEAANTPASSSLLQSSSLFTSQLSVEDKLAEPGKVTHNRSRKSSGDSSSESGNGKSSKSRSRRRRSSGKSSGSGVSDGTQQAQRKQRRRRSTTVSSDGTTQVSQSPKRESSKSANNDQKKSSSNRRRRNKNHSKQADNQQTKNVQVGRNSSALRANRPQTEGSSDKPKNSRRRRRSHKSNSNDKPAE